MATILRTSKYVRNFAEVATKIGFSHIKVGARVNLLSHRHSACARFLATQVAAERLDNDSNLEMALQKLDADVKRFGRITGNKLKRILNAFENSKSISSTQALMVIRCCGNLVSDELPESRSALVNQVWKSLEDSGIQLDLSHYNALLRVYVENEYAFSPTEILAALERKGIEPNKLTYQRLINRYCQQGDIEGASNILEFMREKGISVNENIFTALVRGHSEANDMISAADILSVMRQAGLQPSADTYKELLCGYAKHGDIQSITNTLAECKTKGVRLLDTDYLDVIQSLACNGHGAHVEMILSILPKEVGYTHDALNHVLQLVNAGQIDVAMQVLSSIPNRDRGWTGSSSLNQLAKADLPMETLIDLFKQIKAKGINPQALLIALKSNLVEGNIERSLLLLQALQESGAEIREHYFWPILVVLGRSKNNEGINDLLQRMKTQYNQPISGETLRDYVIPYKTGEPDQILAELLLLHMPYVDVTVAILYDLLSQMKIEEAADFVQRQNFHSKSVRFCQPLAAALVHTRDVKSFVRILFYLNGFYAKTIRNQKIAVDNEILEQYIVAVATSIKEDNCEMLTEVLKHLLSAGCNISDECIATLRRANPRSIPELSELFNRFREKGSGYVNRDKSDIRRKISRSERSMYRFNSNEEAAQSRTQLLHMYSFNADLPNLEKTIAVSYENIPTHKERHELKEQGFIFTNIMYANILDAYLDSDVLDKSEEYIAILRQKDPKSLRNDRRLINYAVLLVKNDRIEDAVKFLQEQESIDVRDYKKHRNIWWKFLNAVSETGSVRAVKEIFDMLLQKGHIEISGLMQGPLIKVHIVRNDLTEALNEFEKICKTYNHTPMKNELAKKLILAEDATSLQHLTDLSTQVHGESNSLYDLALSFIECECLRQATKILQIPALHDRSNKLLTGAKRYMEQGMTIYLERLISVIKHISFFKTMPEFYDNLIFCYDKENDWEKGLELKQQMEEDEVEPSEVFLKTLHDLLERNHQTAPFKVPESQSHINISQPTESQPSKSARNSLKRQTHRIEDESDHDNSAYDLKMQKRLLSRRKSQDIESKLREGDLHAAFEIAQNSLQANTCPLDQTMKYLGREAFQAGQTEILEKLVKSLTSRRNLTLYYGSMICNAYVAAGKSEEYLDKLEQKIEAAGKLGNRARLLEFPIRGVTKMLNEHPEFLEKFTKIAEKAMAEGITLLMNTLWIYHFINGHAEADKIWTEHLVQQRKILFNEIIRIAQMDNNPELLKNLVKTFETAPLINSNAKSTVYSNLIKLLYLDGKYQESIDVLREALKVVSSDGLQDTLAEMKSYLSTKVKALPTDIFPESEVTEDKERMIT